MCSRGSSSTLIDLVELLCEDAELSVDGRSPNVSTQMSH